MEYGPFQKPSRALFEVPPQDIFADAWEVDAGPAVPKDAFSSAVAAQRLFFAGDER